MQGREVTAAGVTVVAPGSDGPGVSASLVAA